MYFLRFTEDPETDIVRGTSLHLSDLQSLEEAKEYYPDLEFIEVKIHGVDYIAQLIDGLCCYALEAETIEQAKEEAKNYFDSCPNAGITETRKPYIFEGEWVENTNDLCPDGDLFEPSGKYYLIDSQ